MSQLLRADEGVILHHASEVEIWVSRLELLQLLEHGSSQRLTLLRLLFNLLNL